MKLIDVIQSLKCLDKIQADTIYDVLRKVQKDLDAAGAGVNIDLAYELTSIVSEIDEVKTQVDTINAKIKHIKDKLKIEIQRFSTPYCVAGGQVDGIPNVEDLDVESTRSLRSKLFSDETNYEIISIIRNNTKPIFPALEIGCGDGTWTKYMVAADPLYITDIHPEFIQSTASQFPIEYQRRLRQYTFGHDGLEKDNFSILPQNQFGFILAVQIFDFFTLDRLYIYIKQIHKLLRPGGIAFFTYNNCEETKNVRLVEQGFKGWALKTEVETFCRNEQFEILNSVSTSEISWMEIKKPGELRTVKTNQALGEIKSITN